jgi:hypothetical protein
MNRKCTLSLVASLAATLCASVNAHAQTCGPGTTGPCVNVVQESNGSGTEAISGQITPSASTSTAISGIGTAGVGVGGTSTSNTGVSGFSGSSSGSFAGVKGQGPSGVVGYTTFLSGGGNGVYGQATAGYGISGYDTSTGIGVIGQSEGAGIGLEGVPTGAGKALFASNTSTTGWAGLFEGRVDVVGAFYVNGACEYDCTSDARLKQNVKPLTGALDQLLQLKGVTYNWKKPEEHENQAGAQTGFIAQEVEKVFPTWVGQNTDGFRTLNIPPMQFAAMQVEAVRALKVKNDELEARLQTLEANRRPLISGLTAEGTLFGVGFVTMAGAFVVSRRKRSETDSHGDNRI